MERIVASGLKTEGFSNRAQSVVSQDAALLIEEKTRFRLLDPVSGVASIPGLTARGGVARGTASQLRRVSKTGGKKKKEASAIVDKSGAGIYQRERPIKEDWIFGLRSGEEVHTVKVTYTGSV